MYVSVGVMTIGTRLTVAEADLVGSNWLVAVTITVSALIVDGEV
jgi:hypothetical protein